MVLSIMGVKVSIEGEATEFDLRYTVLSSRIKSSWTSEAMTAESLERLVRSALKQ
jgi:hypothetical protein